MRRLDKRTARIGGIVALCIAIAIFCRAVGRLGLVEWEGLNHIRSAIYIALFIA